MGSDTENTSRITSPMATADAPAPKDRRYCTHECLIGLVRSLEIDEKCPNVVIHGSEHVSYTAFLFEMRNQVITLAGGKCSADEMGCKAMPIFGSRGSLFKLTHVKRGYTFVGKGFKAAAVEWMYSETRAYDALKHLQGKRIPVHLGNVSLNVPWYNGTRANNYILFLSYAGVTLDRNTDLRGIYKAKRDIRMSLKEIHSNGMLHGSVFSRNMAYDEEREKGMMIDLERVYVPLDEPVSYRFDIERWSLGEVLRI